MKITSFGLAVLGLTLLSTASAQAQGTRSYTNVDAFGNVTTNVVRAPASIGAELVQQRLQGGTFGSASIQIGGTYGSGYGYGYGGYYPGGYYYYHGYTNYCPLPPACPPLYGNPAAYPQGIIAGPIGVPGLPNYVGGPINGFPGTVPNYGVGYGGYYNNYNTTNRVGVGVRVDRPARPTTITPRVGGPRVVAPASSFRRR